MSETKVPPEFEWIKPGVKYYNKKAITKGEIKKSPIWNRIFGCWEAETNNGLSVFCQSIAPLSQMPITLTLTREQAEILAWNKHIPDFLFDKLKEKLK